MSKNSRYKHNGGSDDGSRVPRRSHLLEDDFDPQEEILLAKEIEDIGARDIDDENDADYEARIRREDPITADIMDQVFDMCTAEDRAAQNCDPIFVG